MILRKIKYFVLFILLTVDHHAYGQDYLENFFTQANHFFSQHVSQGRVDYAGIKNNDAKLNTLVSLLNQVDLSNTRSDAKKSFWINTYNLLVIKAVVDHYPVNSVNDIPGFFDKKQFTIKDEELSLNDIEEKKLSVFKDARINLLLCKGQRGSPPLIDEAYSPMVFSSQEINQTIAVINDTSFTKKGDGDSTRVATLFFEKKNEFTLTNPSLQIFINRYHQDPVGPDSLFEFFKPDERLNDKTPLKPIPQKKEITDTTSKIKDIEIVKPSVPEQEYLSTFFELANNFFNHEVYLGKVDYTGIKKHPDKLNRLVNLIYLTDPGKEKNDTKKAFWVNAYNLLVIKSIIDHYPVPTVDSIPGFFETKQFKIKGEELSLDDIEEKKLKEIFKDPRINFLLCKGYLGSPAVLDEGYDPDVFTTQVINQTVTTLNDTSFIKKLPDGSYLVADLFSENKNDFTLTYENLQSFINKYRLNPVGNDSLFAYHKPDKRLNEDEINLVINDKNIPEELALKKVIEKDELSSEADDGLTAGLLILPKGRFEIRLNNNMTSYKEFYNRKLTRSNTNYSYAANNSTFQLLYGAGRRTSIGLAVSGRSARLAGPLDTPADIYKFQVDSNSINYLRTFTPSLRFNIGNGFIKINNQTYFNIPLRHVKNLKYDGYRLIDENPYLLGSQFYFFRYFSEYVKVVLEVDANFKFDNHLRSFTIAPHNALSSIFSLPVTHAFRLYGLVQYVPTGNTSSYFSSYYFKEAIGLKSHFGKSEFTLYYSYLFLGKQVNAFGSLVLNVRIGL